jgi:hypothetical protein
VGAAVGFIADGIRSGLFPPHPPEPSSRPGYTPCRYCDPDERGSADRHRAWLAMRSDPAVAAYAALVGEGVGT